MPTFDYQRARDAGMSDKDISAYLAERAAQGVQLTVVGRGRPSAPARLRVGEALEASPVMTQLGPVRVPLRRLLRAAPDIGGGIAGLAGGLYGPQAVALAAVGGAVGEGVRQAGEELLFGAPPIPKRERAQRIATQAGGQAAAEAVGGQVGRAVGHYGRSFLRKAVSASPTLRKQFPDLLKTIVEERLPVSFEAGKGSAEAASTLRQRSASGAKSALKQAERLKTRIPIEQIAEPALAGEASVLGRELTDRERQEIIDKVYERAKEMVGEQQVTKSVILPRRIKPTQAQVLKRSAQRIAKAGRVARSTGQPVLGDALLDDYIARGTRAALEAQVEGLAKINARTQRLIGLERAMREAEVKGSTVPLTIFGPARPFGSLSPYLMLPRQTVSEAGTRLLSEPAQQLGRQAPRSLFELYRQLTPEVPEE